LEETDTAPPVVASYGMALDPGETAGLVVTIFDHQKFELVQVGEFAYAGIIGSLSTMLEDFKPKVVICESFRLYQHKAKAQIHSSFPTVEMIGMLKAVCWLNGLDDPIMQSPTCKGNVNILPRHRLTVGSSPHVQDAYRHFRYWWITEYRS